MPDKTCKYSTDITAAWAVRYLERLERPFDDWQIDCFRRGCSFLAKGVTEGAISSWDLMHLPDEDRRNAYSGP